MTPKKQQDPKVLKLVRQYVAENAQWRKLAHKMNMEPEDYADLVVHYMQNPGKGPPIPKELVMNAAAKAKGLFTLERLSQFSKTMASIRQNGSGKRRDSMEKARPTLPGRN